MNQSKHICTAPHVANESEVASFREHTCHASPAYTGSPENAGLENYLF